MKIVLVVDDRPLSARSWGGGGLVFAGTLGLLIELGHRVHLAVLDDPARRDRGFDEWCRSRPEESRVLLGRLDGVDRLPVRRNHGSAEGCRPIRSILQPLSRVFPEVTGTTAVEFARLCERARPDLVWASGMLPAACVGVSRRRSWVYEFTDWWWKITELRFGRRTGPRAAWGRWVRQRAECELVRRASLVVTGSRTEKQRLVQAGARRVEYLPPVLPATPVGEVGGADPVRVVHLGGLATTATLLGLERFLERVWPGVAREAPGVELWVVGDTALAPEAMLRRLRDVGAVITGWVGDLSTVLRPYDIHVVPWEHDTGVRTRVLPVFERAQALVAARPAVIAHQGLESGRNCILVDSLDSMAGEIVSLTRDRTRRERLGRSGRRFLEEHFAPEVGRERLRTVLEPFVALASVGQ